MRILRGMGWFVLLAMMVGFAPDVAGQPPQMSRDMREVLSRLQAMGHGYHSEMEWAEVFSQLDAVGRRAEELGHREEIVEAGLVRAMVYSDMREDHIRALEILDELMEEYGHLDLRGIRKVYVRLAQVYAEMGDENAISDLIAEFRDSPHYDAQSYSYAGGQGRDVPLAIARPWAKGNGSLTITAMEKARAAARLAPGRPCPAFETVDSEGVSLRLADYAGQVVLLDFWVGRWESWRRELPRLAQVYHTYHPYGFHIVGFCLDGKPRSAQYLINRNRATWRQVLGDRKVPALFGVYGEAANILVDGNGMILGRNLKGEKLKRAVARALGSE